MNQSNQTFEGGKVYAMVTNRIIELLEQGIIPWRKTWTESGLPQNLITGKQYRGINVWLLASLNYKQNLFLTFKQARDSGGTIKQGEKGHIILFVEWIYDENPEKNETVKKSILRYYKVFNIAQCEGIPIEIIPKIEVPNNPINTCEKIINQMPQCPAIHFQDGGPYYNQDEDYINMPLLTDFESSEEFYLTFFHELIHSTGHECRLKRNVIISKGRRGVATYSLEELTAELGACYLSFFAGLKNLKLENSASYIQHWLDKLKNDKRLIVFASAQAQRAVEFILNSAPKRLNKEKEEVLVQ